MTYIPTPVDRLHSSAQKIDALAWMLFLSLQQDEGLKLHADGIHSLFEDQAREVKAVALEQEAARDTTQTERPAGTSWRFQAVIDKAEAALVAAEDAEAERLHQQAAKVGTAFDLATPDQLRKQFIRTSLDDGADAADIAEALNMKQAAVDKLISQMTPQRRPDTPSAPSA